jgi:hypothetical protein
MDLWALSFTGRKVSIVSGRKGARIRCVSVLTVPDTFKNKKRIIIRGEDYEVAVKEEGLEFLEFNLARGC